MFDRFTERALQAIMIAQEEARRIGHNHVGSEQLLLGLIGEGTGLAHKVLKEAGLKLRDVRKEVEKIVGKGNGFVSVEVPFTPRAKRVLEIAFRTSNEYQHGYIGTEHLLVALLKDEKGVAYQVLINFGLDIQTLRSAIFLEIEKDNFYFPDYDDYFEEEEEEIKEEEEKLPNPFCDFKLEENSFPWPHLFKKPTYNFPSHMRGNEEVAIEHYYRDILRTEYLLLKNNAGRKNDHEYLKDILVFSGNEKMYKKYIESEEEYKRRLDKETKITRAVKKKLKLDKLGRKVILNRFQALVTLEEYRDYLFQLDNLLEDTNSAPYDLETIYPSIKTEEFVKTFQENSNRRQPVDDFQTLDSIIVNPDKDFDQPQFKFVNNDLNFEFKNLNSLYYFSEYRIFNFPQKIKNSLYLRVNLKANFSDDDIKNILCSKRKDRIQEKYKLYIKQQDFYRVKKIKRKAKNVREKGFWEIKITKGVLSLDWPSYNYDILRYGDFYSLYNGKRKETYNGKRKEIKRVFGRR